MHSTALLQLRSTTGPHTATHHLRGLPCLRTSEGEKPTASRPRSPSMLCAQRDPRAHTRKHKNNAIWEMTNRETDENQEQSVARYRHSSGRARTRRGTCTRIRFVRPCLLLLIHDGRGSEGARRGGNSHGKRRSARPGGRCPPSARRRWGSFVRSPTPAPCRRMPS